MIFVQKLNCKSNRTDEGLNSVSDSWSTATNNRASRYGLQSTVTTKCISEARKQQIFVRKEKLKPQDRLPKLIIKYVF